MCFSAEASFTAAAVLAVAGYFTTKVITDRRLLFMAVIPFLFAIQQLSEGFLWLAIKNPTLYVQYARFEIFSFLFFALLVWPFWIPFSLYMAEEVLWKKRVLAALIGVGIFYDATIMIKLIESWPLNSIATQIHAYSIHYILPWSLLDRISPYANITVYALATLAPIFISSIRSIWILGIAFLFGFVVATIYFEITFVSVWCFFAAWVSLFLYFILRNQEVPAVGTKKVR